MYSSYFLFHAALVMALCIISFPQSPDIQTWYEDIQLARSTFRERLIEDSLSARCVAILDQAVPNNNIDSGLFRNVQLDRDAFNDFLSSMESNEMFNSFDWDSTSGI